MDPQMNKLQRLGYAMQHHGLDMLYGLIILIVGLMITKWLLKLIRNLLDKLLTNATLVSVIANCIGVFLMGLVITASAMQIGLPPGPLITLMMIVVLTGVGIIVIFRPLVPTLPFKVGNVVRAGNLLGKIEATTALNTRLRTFDGKTFFVPNRQVLGDVVVNYHYTKTRRVKIDIAIRYDQDMIKAKRVLEALMIEDARVLNKPSPQVYVMALGPNGIHLGGRCWVNNNKFWVTRCDLLEKTKLRFDREGLAFAYHQLDVNHHYPVQAVEPEEIWEGDAQ